MKPWFFLLPLLAATAQCRETRYTGIAARDYKGETAVSAHDIPSVPLPPSAISGTAISRQPVVINRAAKVPNPLWGKVTKTAVHACHGVFMAFAFVVVLPLGAMSPHFSFLGSHKLRFHIGCQLFAYALILMGFVFGLWVAVGAQDWFYDSHTQLGFCIVGLISLQPLIGVWHHLNFRRSGVRSWRYNVHVWFGRALIVMGIVDGGLGLRLAANYNRGELVAYIVLSVVFFLLYVGAFVLGLFEKGRSDKIESSLPESPTTKAA